MTNFGRFTWETFRTYIGPKGRGKWRKRRRPVFIPADSFLRAYNVEWRRPVVPPVIEPCEELNFTKLAIKSAAPHRVGPGRRTNRHLAQPPTALPLCPPLCLRPAPGSRTV